MRHKEALHLHLKKILSQKNVKTVKELFALHEVPGQSSHPKPHQKNASFIFLFVLYYCFVDYALFTVDALLCCDFMAYNL
jgi:hypothetical protein